MSPDGPLNISASQQSTTVFKILTGGPRNSRRLGKFTSVLVKVQGHGILRQTALIDISIVTDRDRNWPSEFSTTTPGIPDGF
jgi:hypothetical protein